MAAFVLALTADLHLPACQSLKEKRSVVKSIVEGAIRRYGVASAEVDEQDIWQRTELAFVAVSGSARQSSDMIDAVERFVWSFAEVEVLGMRRDWLEVD